MIYQQTAVQDQIVDELTYFDTVHPLYNSEGSKLMNKKNNVFKVCVLLENGEEIMNATLAGDEELGSSSHIECLCSTHFPWTH